MAKLTPIKAIRAKCRDCCCGSTAEIRACPVKDCPIYPYRMGRRPKIEESYTPDDDVGENLALGDHSEGDDHS